MQSVLRVTSARGGFQHATRNSQRVLAVEAPHRRFVGLARQDSRSPHDRRGFNSFVPQMHAAGKQEQGRTLPLGEKTQKAAESRGDHTTQEEIMQLDPASKWKQITVEMWRDAVYTNQAYFGELINDTSEFVKSIAQHIKLSGRGASLVEVGCGTGEFVRAVEDEFRTAVGVDFNQEFIDFCNEHAPARNVGKTHFVQGDACELNQMLAQTFENPASGASGSGTFWNDSRVVACVGNTIGIIPEELRPKVYEEMAELAGKDGVLVMVYWNARWFGDACLNFYHANPNLCGEFEGKSIDFKTTSLTTPMGYKTKWTGVEEARIIMENLGMEIISIKEQGKGVFVAARKL